MRIYRNHLIEELAEERLAQLEKLLAKPLSPPIPIDLLAEKVLGLDFLWQPIDELPGEIIFGGLLARERLIVLNERRAELLRRKPGLERSTKGHEMGHWDLFVDKATLNYPSFSWTGDDPKVVFRSSPAGDVAVLKLLLADPEGQKLLRRIQARADKPDEARAVNRYAAAISMPSRLLRDEARAIDRTEWRNLYPLAEKFDVTITALKVRLEQLDLLRIGRDGKLYDSPDRARGQSTFF
ncbi:MAG TPA: hypothetical protein VG013_00595 [Gemmataceae bacterium]|jgi:hypothetical protein|nr:hypothetical protein [Gemmataceae bacterium]